MKVLECETAELSKGVPNPLKSRPCQDVSPQPRWQFETHIAGFQSGGSGGRHWNTRLVELSNSNVLIPSPSPAVPSALQNSHLGRGAGEIEGGSVGEHSMEEGEPLGGVKGGDGGERGAAAVVRMEPEVAAAASAGDEEEGGRGVEAGEGVALDSEGGVNGGAGADGAGEESAAADVDGGAVEEVLEGASVNAGPDVEGAGVEVASEEVDEVGAEVPVEESSEGEALDVPVEEVVAGESSDGSLEVEAVTSATDGVEEKGVEVHSGDGDEVTEGGGNEDAGPDFSAEVAPDRVASEALDAPVEENAAVEGVTANAEEGDEPASQQEASPKSSEGEPLTGTDASVETVGGSVDEELMEQSEPSEGVDAHVEEVEKVASSNDVEEKAVEVETGDASEDASPKTPSEAVDASVEEAVSPTDAETGVESTVVESVLAPSDDVEEKVVEVSSEEATEAMSPDEVDSEATDAPVEEIVGETSAESNEAVSEPEAMSAPSEEKSIEVDSGDGSEDADADEASSAEVDNEAVDAPVVEESGDVENAASSVDDAEPGVESTSEQVEPQMPASETEEQNSTIFTSTSLPADEELFDLVHWELMGRAAEGVPSEREAETVPAEDRSFQVEELPQESQAQSQSQSILTNAELKEEQVAEIPNVRANEGSSEELLTAPVEHTSELRSDVLAEPCDKDPLTEELEHPTASAANIPTIIGSEAKELPNTDDDDVADGTIKSAGVTHLLQTVMTDEEAKAAAISYPEEPVEAEAQVPEAGTAHEESGVETVAGEFSLNDVSKALISSEKLGTSDCDSPSHVVSPYLAAASSESDERTPKAYNLDEVAANLHDAAAKTLEDAEAGDVGENQSSLAKSVAQIVLEESTNAKDSSEYISGVVRHVAQLAQDAGQSDPNVLPDTVARVFDGETTASPANQVTQPKEISSLGTMVSLFVIWCVSLCASRISSKDMPAPALKLAAEEVAAVLHTNAPSQPTLAQGTATSNH